MLIGLLHERGPILALVAAAALGQTPAQGPAFEVASIRPARLPTPNDVMSGRVHIGMKVDAARVDIGNLSLADLLRIAYRVKRYQVSGPSWMSAERFDVQAKLPEGASSDQAPEMLQALLAERFHLEVHRETREHAVYAMVVGKNGPKLKASPPDAAASAGGVPAGGAATGGIAMGAGDRQVRISGTPGSGRGMVITGGQAGTMRVSMEPGGIMHLEASKMTPAALADTLSRFVDRPVVDMTGLKGAYQVALDISMGDLREIARAAGMALPMRAAAGDASREPAGGASDPSGSSIFAAMQELGLKLEPRKAPLEVIVVDRLDKTPTEN